MTGPKGIVTAIKRTHRREFVFARVFAHDNAENPNNHTNQKFWIQGKPLVFS